MALLLNRKYGSRLECLYYILKSSYKKYGTKKPFGLSDLKFDEEDEFNVHHYCKLTKDVLGMSCCPFLNNPLDSSKCYATQSLESDSTKSKAVSDIGGSLEALGFIRRIGRRSYLITEMGEKWVKVSFTDIEWLNIAKEAVLSYGVVVGFLALIKGQPDIVNTSSIYVGYPQTEEIVAYIDEAGEKHFVSISTGSEKDSVTRTKSRIIAWCISVGLIEPVGVECDETAALPHLRYRKFLNQKELIVRKFKKTEAYDKVFENKFEVSNPLAYSRLHKSVEAMRENGGEILRLATMKCKNKILNRRFVFTYVLNEFSKANKKLRFESLVEEMQKKSDYIFTEGNEPMSIMSTECQIADLTGLPFVDHNGMLETLTTINKSVLCEDAPREIIGIAEEIIKRF